ncbi:amidohydrolase family protein [Steroidobacter sp.]|uniref:amidohydrolase family protein n=1 Tax=Steroidobacter sp. TaxID=1978227 RepID=UPI001A63E19D|nr:amidohydrolase family protein [Steroidobacter sp.]MBL8271470.1 amidohydrolase family protein [Steroidobacter sp.]
MNYIRWISGLVSVIAASTATAAGSILLTGADIYTVSNGVIRGGELLIADGRIAAVSTHIAVAAGTPRLDVSGKRIYPGLIDANSIIGLLTFPDTENSAKPQSHMFQEIGPNNANLVTAVAVDPDTVAWPVARAEGVLAALVAPAAGRDAIIAGRSTLMKPDGWTATQMTIAPKVGLHLYWPETAAQLEVLESIVAAAREYRVEQLAGRITVPDLKLEGLLPALERRMPVMIHTRGVTNIRAALDFSQRHELRMVLVEKPGGVTDAWRVAPRLAALQVPVIVGKALLGHSRRWVAYDERYTAVAELAKAGVKVVVATNNEEHIMTGGPAVAGNLHNEAGIYAAWGLDAETALRAITLSPAEVLGVADRLGSLEVGKVATLFVADGDILEASTRVERVWIDGREIDIDDTHHTQLLKKYQRKYRGEPKP